MEEPALSPVGHLIRHWRRHRHLSQLGLALESGVSTRHLSFIETGRAQPSREMVIRLSDVLDVPLRERNSLLEAAGYAQMYRESDLHGPELEQVRRALEFMLERFEPNGAVVVDRYWNVLMTNRGAQKLMGTLLGSSFPASGEPLNLVRLLFDPSGLRPMISNWPEVARALVDRIHRESLASADEEGRALLEELLSYPGVPERWSTPDLQHPPALLIPIEFVKDDIRLRLFTTITTLGTPQDITLQELRIECFFPMDAESEAAQRRLVQDS